jgi:predicted naringenin-chalcone synthase
MKTGGGAWVAAVEVATPPFAIGQKEAAEYLVRHYGDRLSPRSLGLMEKLFAHPSIRLRHFAIEEPESLFAEDPDSRIERFTSAAVELSAIAALKAVAGAGLSLGDVSAVVLNTCTGYICPGVSTYLMEKLGLPSGTRAYDLVGSGCGGAIPNLEVAAGSLSGGVDGGKDKAVLSVSVEICSATFQMGDELSLLVSNALFADGAAAAVLWRRPQGLELVASASRYVPAERDAIRYVYRDGQLHNQLSTLLPRMVRKAVAQVVADVLGPVSLSVEDIRHWAIHTGGEKIINSVRDELGLAEAQVAPAREVLAQYGNMSSPTVWFVMKELMKGGIAEGDWVMMVAFGAGLSAHAFLMRKTA